MEMCDSAKHYYFINEGVTLLQSAQAVSGVAHSGRWQQRQTSQSKKIPTLSSRPLAEQKINNFAVKINKDFSFYSKFFETVSKSVQTATSSTDHSLSALHVQPYEQFLQSLLCLNRPMRFFLLHLLFFKLSINQSSFID